jgi:hypothetical protein
LLWEIERNGSRWKMSFLENYCKKSPLRGKREVGEKDYLCSSNTNISPTALTSSEQKNSHAFNPWGKVVGDH